MIFKETPLKGAFIIELERIEDARGFFARSWCVQEFEKQGIHKEIVQCNISYNAVKGTLRGMHYQKKPHQESKLVRCTAGAIFDVIIDLRDDSPTFMKWISVELNAENRKMIYIPDGFAHGFITLMDHTEIFYQMTAYYTPAAARGIRFDDPAFNIQWPAAVNIISEQDKNYPDFTGVQDSK